MACEGFLCRHTDPPTQHTNTITDDTSGGSVPEGSPVVISFMDAGSDCTSDALGQFGSSSGQLSKVVQYGYELETKPDLEAAVLTYVILPDVERQINDVLVSVVFENCGTRRRLYAGGLTSFPPDQISPNVPCQGVLSDESNTCFVMVGEATVFSQEEVDEAMLEAARLMVRQAMEEGEFNGIHEGLVGVQYHDMDDSQVSAPVPNVSAPAPAPADQKDGYIWGIVAAAAVCAVVAVALLARRQMKRQRLKAVGELGIRPLTPDDLRSSFDARTRSSWDVLQHSLSSPRQQQELGISARELVDSPSKFDRSTRSSWDVLSQTPPQLPT